MRRRTLIAAAWVFGATVPLLLGAVFLVGCCILPFHGLIHKLAPICETAAAMMTGDHHDGDHHDPAPAAPARQKDEPVKRIVTEASEVFRLTPATVPHLAAATAATDYRSFISLGASRCDQDIGLYVLVDSFLI
jgi:hypothetical protein